MQKRVHFDKYWGWGWPEPWELEHYFLAPSGKEWVYKHGNDAASLRIEGAGGTGSMQPNHGRIDVGLEMWGNPHHGVLLLYSKWGGGFKENYTSKGDLRRLREWVRGLHGTPLPVGLFIPFCAAWPAVKEFMETDGELPKSIAWIANRDLPPNTFPDP